MDQKPIAISAILLVFISSYILFNTRWGLRTRSVGEHPRAADTVGINVYFMRYANVIIGGLFAGLAGAYLTLESVPSFEPLMTNGRGFIALAAMIFGNWTPIRRVGGRPALWRGASVADQPAVLPRADPAEPGFPAAILHRRPDPVHPDHDHHDRRGGQDHAPAADGQPYEK